MNQVLHDTVTLDVVDSTNAWAKNNISTFSQDKPTCITARGQTHGHGRYGQTWLSPRNQNLYFTLAEKVLPPLTLLHYAEIATLAVQNTLWEWQLPSQIKWPNDIIVDEQKIAGVIVEETTHKDASWAILGIGLNINMTREELREIGRPATSMSEALGTPFPIDSILKTLKEKLLELLIWAKSDPELCHKRWANACSWIIGKEISVHTGPIAQVSGIAQEITPTGRLLVKTSSGKIVEVASGTL